MRFRRTVTWDDILLGKEVQTGAWMVPDYIGDCPNDKWPLASDLILILAR